MLEILSERKNLIAPILLKGEKKDIKRLRRLASCADIVQVVLPNNGILGLDRRYFLRDHAEFSLPAVLEACAQFSARQGEKFILLAGVQQVLACGLAEFFADFTRAGAGAFMFSDLAPEESADFLTLAERYQTPLIFQAMQSAPETRISELLQISPQIITAVTAAANQENLETDRLLDTVNRLRRKNAPLVLIDHALKQEDNLLRVWQAADGVILSHLADMPDTEVLRALKRLKKFLTAKRTGER